MTIVGQPASDVLGQVIFQPSITFAITAVGQVLEGAFELGLTLLGET